MGNYLFRELQKAWIWYKKIVSIFAQWIFQTFLRLLILCVILYLVGGGCFLKAWRESKEPQKHIVMPAQYGAVAGYEPNQQIAIPVYREKSGDLQTRIRTGASQVRSWDYTLRSIKNDIERWFRK